MDSSKALVAPLTYVWFLPSVSSDMRSQLLSGKESFHALGTLVRELVQMSSFPETWELQNQQLQFEFLLPVINERWLGAETAATVGAEEVSFSSMDNIVDSQLLSKCKLFSTHITLKRFLS